MNKRGVFIFLVFFLLNFSAFASEIFFNYTVLPAAKGLSGVLKDNIATGGFHNIIKEITKDTNLVPKFIEYEDYDSAIQNTLIYTSISNPEIILGATFSEDNIKYLDYVSVPIYKDYFVLIANKETVNKFKFSKDLISDLKNINLQLVSIKGFKIPYSSKKYIKEYKNTNMAMEEVFVNNNMLLVPKTLLDYYLEKNKNSKELSNLKIIEYKDFPIYYFFAVNKKSNLYTMKYDENHFISDYLFEKLQDNINKDMILKIIENK